MLILIIILCVVSIPFAVALFLKKEIIVLREVTINKPKAEIFNFIKYVKNHDAFSVWAQMDPDMKKEYKGNDGTVGFVFGWESLKSKNVGKGEQEIKKITEGESIEFELRFQKPMENKAVARMIIESVSPVRSKVKWTFESAMKYPMNFMRLIMNFDKLLGKDLQTGLENLKRVMEK